MGAVVEAIVDAGSDIVEAAGDVVSDVGKAVESVGQAIGDTAEAIAQDPIPVLVSVAAQAVGVPAPLTAAAITAARGGSIEDIAKSAGAAYVGGQITQGVSDYLPAGTEPVIRDIVGGTLASGTSAAITGGDIGASALAGGVGSGVARSVAPTVGSATARAIGQTAGGIAAGIDPSRAAAAGLTSAGMSQLSGAAKDIYQAVTRGNEPVTAGTEFAPLASGGVASDVSPTPLVRMPERQGTVSVTQAPQEFQNVGMGGELAEPSLADFEEAEYQEQLRRADQIVQQQQQQTQRGYQPILSPVDQQVYNLLVSGMGLRSDRGEGARTKTPAEQAKELATGFVTRGGTGGGGRQAEQGSPSGESMIGGGGGEGTGGTGTGFGEQATSADQMMSLTARVPTERGATRMTRAAGGIPQADSMLGALLGTALTPAGSTEPIMGEDESKRRAVWNLESLRNALGI